MRSGSCPRQQMPAIEPSRSMRRGIPTFLPIVVALILLPPIAFASPPDPSWIAVASAPAAFRVRVWAIMSRRWEPRGGRAVPEGVYVDYAPLLEAAVSESGRLRQVVGGHPGGDRPVPTCQRRLSSGSAGSDYETNFGDLTIAPRVILSETQNVTQSCG
jgi:hypothetical protein